MGFDEGHLVFDHENLTYYSGELVSGKLIFDQTKVKTFRGIYLSAKGECNVHWTTKHERRVNDRVEHYNVEHNSHEEYFQQKVYLMGGTQGEVHLQPGHYEVPFQVMLPATCPSSFEGSNGNIRYTFKVVVDRAFKFDQEKSRTITVVNQRDLNRDPYCKEPMLFEFEETYCCWCISSGMCELTAKLPQSGYCPGQTMRIDVSCANKSNVEIDEIKFELIEFRKFRAFHNPDTRSEENVIAKLKKGPVAGNTTRTWTVEIDVPQMDLYNVDSCQFIDIHHEFKVVLSPSGCHNDADSSRRIVLGHIPLREFEGPAHPDTIISQPVAPTMNSFTNYPNQPNPNNGVNAYPPTQGYPTVSPYPAPSPYPGPTYPTGPGFPGGSPGYPGGSPYPGSQPPYPAAQGMPGVSPYPVTSPREPGFSLPGGDNPAVPLLSSSGGMPYPNNAPVSTPYVAASAPEPSTPH